MVKTREKLNEEVKTLFDNVTKPNVFDDDWVYFFKKWQEKIGKYQDLAIEEVEFEEKTLAKVAKFPSLTRISGIDKSIEEYNVLSEEEKNNYYPLISGTLENNQISGYVHKDRIPENSLSKKNIISWTRINAKKIFIQEKEVCTNDDSFVMEPILNTSYIKYLKYAIEYEMANSNFDWTNKAGKGKMQNISIKIPKNTANYSSYEIQKILVEFLEDQKQISDNYRKKLDKIDEDIKEMEENLIPAILNQNDKYVKEMWVKWNTNPVVPRNPEDMVDFKLEDIEFEDKKIGSFTNSKSGSSEYKKEYYQKEENKGEYPLMTGSLNIVAYVKPIKESDVINEESVSYNKDNDGGSKAFYHTKPYIVGGHHYALLLKEEYKNKIVIKYFYYMLKHFFDTHMFYQSKQPVANIGLIKSKTIKIPKSIKTEKKEYSSYEVQKAIVSFIDRFYEWKKQIKEKMEILRNMLDDIDEGFLYKTFKGAE